MCVLHPGCPLDLSQLGGEIGRWGVKGMGRPLSNLSLILRTALSLGTVTERAQASFCRNQTVTPQPICGLTASYFLLQICSLFASC